MRGALALLHRELASAPGPKVKQLQAPSSFPAISSSKEKCLSAFANQNLFILNLVSHPEWRLLGKPVMHYCVRWVNLACLTDSDVLLMAQAGLGEVKEPQYKGLCTNSLAARSSHTSVPAWARLSTPLVLPPALFTT